MLVAAMQLNCVGVLAEWCGSGCKGIALAAVAAQQPSVGRCRLCKDKPAYLLAAVERGMIGQMRIAGRRLHAVRPEPYCACQDPTAGKATAQVMNAQV